MLVNARLSLCFALLSRGLFHPAGSPGRCEGPALETLGGPPVETASTVIGPVNERGDPRTSHSTGLHLLRRQPTS